VRWRVDGIVPDKSRAQKKRPAEAGLFIDQVNDGSLLRRRSRRSRRLVLLGNMMLLGMSRRSLRIGGRGGRGRRIGSHHRTGQQDQGESRNEFANHESSPLRNISTLATNGIKSILLKPLYAMDSDKAFPVITTLHGGQSVHERGSAAISSLLIRSKDGNLPFLREFLTRTLRQNRAAIDASTVTRRRVGPAHRQVRAPRSCVPGSGQYRRRILHCAARARSVIESSCRS
jgi:hypothetical protein